MMIKRNCFECTITVYDSVGFEREITELPMTVRRKIANAIISGHTFGTFEGEFEDVDLMSELHPVFVDQLREVNELHKKSVESRKVESAARVAEQKQQEEVKQETVDEEYENGEESAGESVAVRVESDQAAEGVSDV